MKMYDVFDAHRDKVLVARRCTKCGKTLSSNIPIDVHDILNCTANIAPSFEQRIEELERRITHLEGFLNEYAPKE